MIRQKKQLTEAMNYIQQFAEQLGDVHKSIQRDNENDEIDLSYLINSENLCNQIMENISNQIDIIEKSEVYSKEFEERYETKDMTRESKRRV